MYFFFQIIQSVTSQEVAIRNLTKELDTVFLQF